MSYLIGAILIGLIPAVIARNKGRSFGVWWFYGAMLFFVALPHALLLKADQTTIDNRLINEGMKKCPHCAEIVKGDAKVCRFCGRDIGDVVAMVSTPLSPSPRSTLGFSLILLAAGILLGLCLISYDPADPALNVTSSVQHINNLGGVVGAYTADILLSAFGISAYLLSLVFILMSLSRVLGRPIRDRDRDIICYPAFFVFSSVFMHLRFETIHIHGQPIEAGGLLGGLLGEVTSRMFGRTVVCVISSAVLLLCFAQVTNLFSFSKKCLSRLYRQGLTFLR